MPFCWDCGEPAPPSAKEELGHKTQAQWGRNNLISSGLREPLNLIHNRISDNVIAQFSASHFLPDHSPQPHISPDYYTIYFCAAVPKSSMMILESAEKCFLLQMLDLLAPNSTLLPGFSAHNLLIFTLLRNYQWWPWTE